MKNKKLLLVLGLIGVMGTSVMAKPVYEEIKTFFNPNIKYTLNGEEVLKDKGAIIYKDKVYLPIRDAATVLDVDIDYQNQTVMLKNNKEEVVIEDIIKEDDEDRSMSFEGIIKDIDIENNRVLIKDFAKDSELVLTLLDDTKILKDGSEKVFNIKDLNEGIKISGQRAIFETLSLPPQTPAFEILITDFNNTQENIQISEEFSGVVKEVRKDSILIKTLEKEIVLNISDKETEILGLHEDKVDKRIYTIEDIKEGMKVSGVKSQMETRSIPAQSQAFVINIHI